MVETSTTAAESVEHLVELIHASDPAGLAAFVDTLEPREAARALCELSPGDESLLLSQLPPRQACKLLRDLPDVAVVDAIVALDPSTAAAIVAEMPSDEPSWPRWCQARRSGCSGWRSTRATPPVA